MTLHEEIVELLRGKGRWMTTGEIADAVNCRGNYKKRDKSAMTAFQIHGRTKNYPQFFTRQGTRVGLVEWKPSGTTTPEALPTPTDSTAAQSALQVTDTDEVGTVEYLEQAGFQFLGHLEQLLKVGLPSLEALNNSGVYAVSIPAGYVVEYLSPASAAEKNVLHPWSLDRLADKWVATAEVVYFGLAGLTSARSLRDRLTDLLDHARGKTTNSGPHKGGEILWQLVGWPHLSLWVFPTTGPPVPRATESGLLEAFCHRYGRLPFANRRA